MKTPIGIILLLFLFSPVAIAGVCEEAELSHLPLPPGVTPEVVSQKEVNGMCEFIIRLSSYPGLFSLYGTRDFVISGSMFKEKKEISKESIAEVERDEFFALKPELDRLAAFSYQPKEVKRTAYLFTDPDCPYCNRAKKLIKQFAEGEKLEVKFIFSPVHPAGKAKAISGICGGITFEDYLNEKYGDRTCAKGEDNLRRTQEIAFRLGVSGTPTVILDDGKKLIGLNFPALKESITQTRLTKQTKQTK